MRLDDAEILIGKLALGREYLTRDDARKIVAALGDSARAGRRETFSSAAVRLGYVENRRMTELAELVRTGDLVCRGTCGRRTPLAAAKVPETVTCSACGGPVYAGRPDGSPSRTTGRSQRPEAEAPELVLASLAPGVPLIAEPPPPSDGGLVPPGRRTVLDLSVPDEATLEEDALALAAPAPPSTIAQPLRAASSVLPPPAGSVAPPSPKSTAPNIHVHDDDADSTQDWEGQGERTLEMPSDGPPPVDPGGTTWRTPDPPKKPIFEPITLSPDLQLLAPIGRGGMGAVFRGRMRDGRIVAVKVLGAPPIPEVLSRFEREVRISTKLDHPNIVKVFATGTIPVGPDQGKPYFVMEYVPGRDLATWITEKPRSVPECLAMVRVLCAAMDHAHNRGVIHRDLKPANILVRQGDDHPMICDFGLAKFRAAIQDFTQHTNTGEILGTPSYMPKEQALGHHKLVGPPTDAYALGAVLYHLVTGRPPFLGASAFLTIAKVVREPPELPSKLNPKISPALEKVIMKFLEKEPRDRYPTCGELGRALAAVS